VNGLLDLCQTRSICQTFAQAAAAPARAGAIARHPTRFSGYPRLRHFERASVAVHPTGAQVVLVVEVARTSHAIDRRKVRAYAKIGVPVYWLLDLGARRLEVRWEPNGDEYRSTRLLGESDSAALPEIAPHGRSNRFCRDEPRSCPRPNAMCIGL
jgi:hypothetical protein